jgi:trehalose-phosphatase
VTTFSRARAATGSLGQLPGVHLTEGKEVLEFLVVDPVAHNKGVALRELIDETGARATLFIGDDLTDETAFAVLDDDAGDITVRVSAPGQATRARHAVADPDGVARLLHHLADLLARG